MRSADRKASGTQTPPGGTGVRRGPLLGLTWSHLLNDGAANYLPGVLPALLVSLGEPVQLAGALIAALTLGQALQPVTGWIADRVGGRLLVVSGLALSSVGGGLLGLVGTTWLLVLVLLLIGVGNSLFHPQALAGVRSMLRGRHGLLTSVFLVGGELGRGLWPTAATLVVVNLGLEYLWLVAIPGILTVPVLFHLAPRLPARTSRSSPVRMGLHARPLALLVSYRSVQAFTTYALVTFIPILWHLRGDTLLAGSSIITTMLVVGIVGNLGGGHLADRFGRRPVLLASALATAALVFPVAYLHGAWVWVAAAPLGAALFLTASTTILIGQDIFPENRSMGSGIALGLANGIGAVLVLAVGFFVHDVSDVFTVFWVVAALGVGNAVLSLTFPARLMR